MDFFYKEVLDIAINQPVEYKDVIVEEPVENSNRLLQIHKG